MTESAIEQGEDLQGALGLVVVKDANDRAVLPENGPTGALPLGVISTEPVDGNVGTLVGVTTVGPVSAIAAAPITNGSRLTFDPDGRVRSAGVGSYVLAHAAAEAVAEDDTVAVSVVHEGLSGLPLSAAGVPVFDSSTQLDGSYPRIVAGRADSTTTKWAGAQFITELTIVTTNEKTYQFLKHSYLSELHFFWTGGLTGDWVDYALEAPASIFDSNAGSGQFAKAIGPWNGSKALWKPLEDGDWDLDLVNKTDMHPVPNPGAGQFDWDFVNDTLIVNEDNTGDWDLYDADNTIRRLAVQMPLGRIEGQCCLKLDRPELLLPGWVHTVNVRKDKVGTTLNVSWHIVMGTKDGT